MSTRHSRFGTWIIVKDKNSNHNKIVPGIKTNDAIRKIEVGRKSEFRRKPIQLDNPAGMLIHQRKFGNSDIIGDQEEEQIKEELKILATDFVEHSYNELMDALLDSFYSGSDTEINSEEKYMYIKISSFFLEFNRIRAHEKLIKEKKAYNQKRKDKKNSGPKPILDLPVTFVKSSLKTQNIDFIFSEGYFQILSKTK